jgi:type IX secretion system PorP/SprF family membrane protein
MKNVICVTIFIFSLLSKTGSYGQDPSFSQFFSSPLNINPALTGNINADWRMISNFRTQWIGPASPYTTGTISYDRKVLQNKIPNVVEEKSTFGIGAMLMYDHAMAGIQKSTYGSLNLAYSLLLSDNTSEQRLGVGFGTIYGRRYIDFERLNFEEQFTGYGFNTNLPTGEAALSNMKPYFSVSAGVTYSVKTEKSNWDIGVAGFHLNKPRQTFLEDELQNLPIRKVLHVNYETLLNESIILNANAIYQYQLGAKYYSFGAALGYYVGASDQTILNVGLWYWSDNAIVPYVGLSYKDLQFGLSYDWTISKLRHASPKPKTFEFSVILRGITNPSGVIPCPWK